MTNETHKPSGVAVLAWLLVKMDAIKLAIIDFIEFFLRSSRRWPMTFPKQIERLVKALLRSGFLSEDGKKRLDDEGAASE